MWYDATKGLWEHMNFRSVLLAVCALLPVCVLADTKPPALSSAQLHQMYDKGDYADLLKQLRVILAQKDMSLDRFDLLQLKGEALLRTNADSDAADAFRDAA